jgi:hypothetical protein
MPARRSRFHGFWKTNSDKTGRRIAKHICHVRYTNTMLLHQHGVCIVLPLRCCGRIFAVTCKTTVRCSVLVTSARIQSQYTAPPHVLFSSVSAGSLLVDRSRLQHLPASSPVRRLTPSFSLADVFLAPFTTTFVRAIGYSPIPNKPQ